MRHSTQYQGGKPAAKPAATPTATPVAAVAASPSPPTSARSGSPVVTVPPTSTSPVEPAPAIVVRQRPNLIELQLQYDNGNKKPLEDLVRAWHGIKQLSPEDLNSFFMIGGYHGEPFRGGGWGSTQYWGGYCNHGNVLFPLWHRAYLLRLENALQSIPGCSEVMLPFWDETSTESRTKGIPSVLTQDKFTFVDGKEINNPLKSFVFPIAINDFVNGESPNYSKPAGYETVRYPLSGLVGSPADRAFTAAHNAKYSDPAKNVEILNENVKYWLTANPIEIHGQDFAPGIYSQYSACLNAPNYTVFSNTTSAAQWNVNNQVAVTPLEAPHNCMHLAVGGFQYPGQGNNDIIYGANGDMGENDTAGLDPIFYFHHCFVDYTFHQWQVKHHTTEHLEIIPHYPGTNTVDNQGPTPGAAPNSWLTLDSTLDPFRKHDGSFYTARDMINITHLGYSYGHGSLDQSPAGSAVVHITQPLPAQHTVLVQGINRAYVRGSFLIELFATLDDKKVLVGVEGVLSRWNVTGCLNCQSHLETKAAFALPDVIYQSINGNPNFLEVVIRTRDGELGDSHKTFAGFHNHPGLKEVPLSIKIVSKIANITEIPVTSHA